MQSCCVCLSSLSHKFLILWPISTKSDWLDQVKVPTLLHSHKSCASRQLRRRETQITLPLRNRFSLSRTPDNTQKSFSFAGNQLCLALLLTVIVSGKLLHTVARPGTWEDKTQVQALLRPGHDSQAVPKGVATARDMGLPFLSS